MVVKEHVGLVENSEVTVLERTDTHQIGFGVRYYGVGVTAIPHVIANTVVANDTTGVDNNIVINTINTIAVDDYVLVKIIDITIIMNYDSIINVINTIIIIILRHIDGNVSTAIVAMVESTGKLLYSGGLLGSGGLLRSGGLLGSGGLLDSGGRVDGKLVYPLSMHLEVGQSAKGFSTQTTQMRLHSRVDSAMSGKT